MSKISLTGKQEVIKVEAGEKCEKFDTTSDVSFENGKLVVTARLEIDFSDPRTLEILEQLKLSGTGKGYNCAYAPVKDVSEMTGQFSLNIKADKISELKAYAKQMLAKRNSSTTSKTATIISK